MLSNDSIDFTFKFALTNDEGNEPIGVKYYVMALAFNGWDEVVAEKLFSITLWINIQTSEYGVSTQVESPIFTFFPLVMWKPLANNFVSLLDFYLRENLGLFLIYKQIYICLPVSSTCHRFNTFLIFSM